MKQCVEHRGGRCVQEKENEGDKATECGGRVAVACRSLRKFLWFLVALASEHTHTHTHNELKGSTSLFLVSSLREQYNWCLCSRESAFVGAPTNEERTRPRTRNGSAVLVLMSLPVCRRASESARRQSSYESEKVRVRVCVSVWQRQWQCRTDRQRHIRSTECWSAAAAGSLVASHSVSASQSVPFCPASSFHLFDRECGAGCKSKSSSSSTSEKYFFCKEAVVYRSYKPHRASK